MTKILVAVAWPYTNAPVHFGTVAGACLPADIFARFMRLKGNEVLMVSGSDQHGTPIIFTAIEQNTTPEAIAKKYHEINASALKQFRISYDIFFETTHPHHKEIVHKIFLKLLEKGYIYKGRMPMLYCPKCQRFLPDRYVIGICPYCRAEDAKGDQCSNCGKTYEASELIQPKCRICDGIPEIRESEHFFLKLSALEENLKEFLKDKQYWRENVYLFTKNLLDAGLKDRPITRDLEWGIEIPIPGYEHKKIYVWFEAVIGYLSATIEWANQSGKDWKPFWYDKEAKHFYFIGKDNVPFHSIIWPAILMAYDPNLNLPYDIPANEWLQFRGEKISKSKTKEHSIFLPEYLEKYPADALRFYLAMHMPEKHDTSFDWEEFESYANKLLLGAYGNLANRILVSLLKMGGRIPAPKIELRTEDDNRILALMETTVREVENHLLKCEFKAGIEKIMALVHATNAYFQNTKPWELIKTEPERAECVFYILTTILRNLSILFAPYLPESSEKLWQMLGFEGKIEKWEILKEPLRTGQQIRNVSPLFRKIEILEVKEKKENTIPPKIPNLVVGEVLSVKNVENADKLYEIEVDTGTEKRKIVAGIRMYYTPEELKGRKILIVTNLEPRKIKGIVSNGMLLAAECENKIALICVPALQKGTVVLEGSKDWLSFEEFKATKMKIVNKNLDIHLPDGRKLLIKEAFADREIEEGTEVR